MILTVYVLLQILAVTGLIVTFFKKSIIPSVLTMLVSGVLAVGAWVLDIGTKYVWDSTISAYVTESIIVQTPYLAGMNIAVFGLALLFFYSDLMELIKGESTGLGNFNLKRNAKKGGGF